jgi:DNA-binding NarL/FixJ family response regulator
MDDILIVSDSSLAHSALETALRNAHFPAGLIALLGVLAMFGAASYLARQYQFVLLIVDADFRKRYGSAITEMSAIIRNYSSHTSLYLLFEDDYDARFSSWLPHSKRIFQKIANQDKLEKAVQEIIRLELGVKDSQ